MPDVIELQSEAGATRKVTLEHYYQAPGAINIAVTGGIHSTEDVLKASGSGWTSMNMNDWRNLKAACHTPIRQIRAAMSAVIIWTCWIAGVA
ncbi:hypothetical protein [Neptunomonas sp.]|uniref:hypothetical protein n=1 Tax=Neptunomonas sp. TaxID=1971898 RepID=UPI003568839F